MIDIISLAWNQYDITKEFLERLRKYTDIPHRLIFTDNASTEPISDLVREMYPDAVLITKDTNAGCPGTRNEAMEHTESDIVFWLDNDCMVGPGWYKPLLRELEDKTVGITGNTTNYVVGNPFTLPYPFVLADGKDADWFMGWCVAFRREAYKPINDYNIPVNLDDVELAFGVKSNGYRAAVCDPVFAQHLGSKTGRGWEFDDQAKLRELWENWKGLAPEIFELWK